jgi:hypothetical protein
MTHGEIVSAWVAQGALARGADFLVSESAGQLDLIASVAVKRGVVRAYRLLDAAASDAVVLDALAGLYAELGGMPATAVAYDARVKGLEDASP